MNCARNRPGSDEHPHSTETQAVNFPLPTYDMDGDIRANFLILQLHTSIDSL